VFVAVGFLAGKAHDFIAPQTHGASCWTGATERVAAVVVACRINSPRDEFFIRRIAFTSGEVFLKKLSCAEKRIDGVLLLCQPTAQLPAFC
jgi:hypothetical protein